ISLDRKRSSRIFCRTNRMVRVYFRKSLPAQSPRPAWTKHCCSLLFEEQLVKFVSSEPQFLKDRFPRERLFCLRLRRSPDHHNEFASRLYSPSYLRYFSQHEFFMKLR